MKKNQIIMIGVAIVPILIFLLLSTSLGGEIHNSYAAKTGMGKFLSILFLGASEVGVYLWATNKAVKVVIPVILFFGGILLSLIIGTNSSYFIPM